MPSLDRPLSIGLSSGGLDSLLAVEVIRRGGSEVVVVSFISPFFKIRSAIEGAYKQGVSIYIIDLTMDMMRLLHAPKHGFGSQMNPCIDCHALMLRKAGKLMEELGGSFLFTGEVLGQRPMSQSKPALQMVAKESGYEPYIVRPLSAKLLPETMVEREGIVNREMLLGLSGRSRKPQMRLAKEFGIESYPSPAGGCLLTEPGFCRRLKDLLKHDPMPQIRYIELLKYGRHFRLPSGRKLIVGRHKKDNISIRRLSRPGDILIKVDNIPGPLGLIDSQNVTSEDIQLAMGIVASYSDAKIGEEVKVVYWYPELFYKKEMVKVKPKEEYVDYILV